MSEPFDGRPSGEQPFDERPVTHDDIAGLSSEVAALTREKQRLRGTYGALRTVGVILIIVVLVCGVSIWRFVNYSTCLTNRNQALSGPGAERVNQLLAGFSVALTGAALTPSQREVVITNLDAHRPIYRALPSPAMLAKLPDRQLVLFERVAQAVEANDAYLIALRHHPVCSLWSTS